MNRHYLYFWDSSNQKVLKTDYDRADLYKYKNMFCVDSSEDQPWLRYGRFEEFRQSEYRDTKWLGHPLYTFPPEFRTHLLLLGIS